MNTYLLDRLRASSNYALELAAIENQLKHQGLKGRFRELLIDNLLAPWLPPYASCGTGTIIAAENVSRQSTQDDIIIYDRSLTPPILASTAHAPEGVFLYNSVLARIEVKSTLTRQDIRTFLQASVEICDLKHSIQPGFSGNMFGAFNLLFAFDSDATGAGDPDYQLQRLIEVMREDGHDPVSGKISMLCIPKYGFWKIGQDEQGRCWQGLEPRGPEDRLAWFVGCISNSCYQQHAVRQGRDPTQGLEGGIGMYFPHPFTRVRAS